MRHGMLWLRDGLHQGGGSASIWSWGIAISLHLGTLEQVGLDFCRQHDHAEHCAATTANWGFSAVPRRACMRMRMRINKTHKQTHQPDMSLPAPTCWHGGEIAAVQVQGAQRAQPPCHIAILNTVLGFRVQGFEGLEALNPRR